ncbi:MAG: sulfatase-like hydrolase/transferase [Desulfuromonadaceae bacterium]|nr:sulfatase-like hydrolase/transferase [Desulfuromonadaceae bacterium]
MKFLLYHFVFWVLFFLLCRAIFLLYHLSQTKVLPLATTAGIFLYGLRMDFSTAAYLIVAPYVLWVIQSLIPVPFTKRLIAVYTAFMLLLTALITTSDLEIYKIWGSKLNSQAVTYLKYPKEAIASMSSSPVILLIGICACIVLAGYCLYATLLKQISFEVSPRSLAAVTSRLALFLLFSGVLIVAIRGGTGLAPMNPGFAYFSAQQFANHAALNTTWNLMYDLKHYFRHKNNQFTYMSDAEMHKRVDRLTAVGLPTNTEHILSVSRPNIIVVILESWTADVIGSLGAEKGITPNFDELASHGILFTDFYANGYRTSFGIAAILSGFPSTPEGSILNRANKMERLPTLAAGLKASGYGTSFYYGGDTHFDDMNAFFVHSKFDTVNSKASFQGKDMNSKWGVHDHVLFERVISDLARKPEPFFTALLTISSHEPFDVPMATVFKGDDQPSRFKNSVNYTDRSIKTFIDKARTQPWFKNTLFIFVADHGSVLPLRRPGAHIPERYRIPLLFYGVVIRKEFQGSTRTAIGSQSDIPATIFGQLGLSTEEFAWSNNLFNANRYNFAFYNFSGGFGLKTESQTVVFDTVSGKLIPGNTSGGIPPTAVEEDLKDGQAFLQNLYQKYSRF